MPTPRMSFAIAMVHNKIYCIGGRTEAAGSTEGYTGVNEVYNPETGIWETKTPLLTATSWLVASVVENRIYVIDYSGTNYVYETATDTWTTKAPVPASALNGYASAVFDNKIFTSHARGAAGATTGGMSAKRIYVFGEKANLEPDENPGFVRIYNPLDNHWTYGTDSPTDRHCFGGQQ